MTTIDKEKSTPANTKLTHIAYSVRNPGNGKKPIWIRIGGVFEHRDGHGFDVVCDVLPLDGRVTLRVNTEYTE
jgi:hypothetical protein